jgi:glyoxylase-like metal-dependent hydrolase (beta-lactamase superfamily II)
MARAWGGEAAVTTRLRDGGRLDFASRSFEVHHRPGHSPSDTVFFDAADGTLMAGDHLIKHISSNPLISRPLDGSDPGERPHALLTYMASLRATREMPVREVLPGHGDAFDGHAELIDQRFALHERRARKIHGLLEAEPLSAHEIAQALWGTVAVTQAYLTLSEVLGHVDLLLERGEVAERERDGVIRFEAT